MKIELDKCFAETKADSFSCFKPANRIIGCGKSAAVRKIRCYCRIMNWSGDLSPFFFFCQSGLRSKRNRACEYEDFKSARLEGRRNVNSLAVLVKSNTIAKGLHSACGTLCCGEVMNMFQCFEIQASARFRHRCNGR